MDIKNANINDQFKLLASRQDILAYVLLAGIVGLVIFKFSAAQKEEIHRLNEQITEETAKNDIVSRIAEVEKDIVPYSAFFAKKEDMEIINVISSSARDEGVKIISLTPEQVYKDGEFTRSSFNLVCEANFHNLGKFLNRLETYTSFLSVQDLNIEPKNMFVRQSDTTEQSQTAIRASFKIYFIFSK